MQAAGQIPANIVADTPQAAVPVVGSTITRQARRYALYVFLFICINKYFSHTVLFIYHIYIYI